MREQNLENILKMVQEARDFERCKRILMDSANREVIMKASEILFLKSNPGNLTLEELKERFQAVLV